MSGMKAIAVGASAGGIEALPRLIRQLPATLDAAVFVVLHVGAHRSELPTLLSTAGPLPAKHPEAGEKVVSGQIYVAPPDHHLTVRDGRVHLSRGPRENWARPAINPLFRSAAAEYGRDLIGIVLTGRLNDGSAGLLEVKRHGGTTIVQAPEDAAYPSMPSSALAHVAPDHSLPLDRIGALVARLVERHHPETVSISPTPEGGHRMSSPEPFDRPFALTCPDCGGALRPVPGGALVEYRCHILHVYTAEVLAEAQFEQMERIVRAAERVVHERSELCLQRADHADRTGHGEQAQSWRVASRQALDRAYELRDLIEQDWVRPEMDAPAAALAS